MGKFDESVLEASHYQNTTVSLLEFKDGSFQRSSVGAKLGHADMLKATSYGCRNVSLGDALIILRDTVLDLPASEGLFLVLLDMYNTLLVYASETCLPYQLLAEIYYRQGDFNGLFSALEDWDAKFFGCAESAGSRFFYPPTVEKYKTLLFNNKERLPRGDFFEKFFKPRVFLGNEIGRPNLPVQHVLNDPQHLLEGIEELSRTDPAKVIVSEEHFKKLYDLPDILRVISVFQRLWQFHLEALSRKSPLEAWVQFREGLKSPKVLDSTSMVAQYAHYLNVLHKAWLTPRKKTNKASSAQEASSSMQVTVTTAIKDRVDAYICFLINVLDAQRSRGVFLLDVFQELAVLKVRREDQSSFYQEFVLKEKKNFFDEITKLSKKHPEQVYGFFSSHLIQVLSIHGLKPQAELLAEAFTFYYQEFFSPQSITALGILMRGYEGSSEPLNKQRLLYERLRLLAAGYVDVAKELLPFYKVAFLGPDQSPQEYCEKTISVFLGSTSFDFMDVFLVFAVAISSERSMTEAELCFFPPYLLSLRGDVENERYFPQIDALLGTFVEALVQFEMNAKQEKWNAAAKKESLSGVSPAKPLELTPGTPMAGGGPGASSLSGAGASGSQTPGDPGNESVFVGDSPVQGKSLLYPDSRSEKEKTVSTPSLGQAPAGGGK